MSYGGIRSGDLRRRITFQTRTTSVDTFGQQGITWADYLSCWADIQPMSGRELISAQALQAETTHEVVIRFRAGIVPAMRVVYQARRFNVLSVIDNDMQHRRLSLLCSEGLNQG